MQLSILVDNSQKVDLGPEAKAAPSVSRQDLDQVGGARLVKLWQRDIRLVSGPVFDNLIVPTTDCVLINLPTPIGIILWKKFHPDGQAKEVARAS